MQAAQRVVVAINPSVAFGRTAGAGARVVQALRAEGHDVVELRAADFGALTGMAREAVGGHPDAFVVVGGDGMVSLGVNVLAAAAADAGAASAASGASASAAGTAAEHADAPASGDAAGAIAEGDPVAASASGGARGVPALGIVPTGTGNDAALGLGIPLEFDAALAHLLAALHREPRTIDLGHLRHGGGELWFASALSAGFDALVNERANHMRRPRGASRYTIALLLELLRLHPRTYRLTVDGASETVDSVLLAVANNTSIGGGMLITPDALLDDGHLDLFVVAPISRLRFLRLFPKVFKGTHTTESIVSLRRVRSVTVDAPDIVAYADGERVGPLPVTVTIAPAALRVLA